MKLEGGAERVVVTLAVMEFGETHAVETRDGGVKKYNGSAV